jgi:hypothetical protein
MGARELLANLPVDAFLRESEMPVLLLGHGSARSGSRIHEARSRRTADSAIYHDQCEQRASPRSSSFGF